MKVLTEHEVLQDIRERVVRVETKLDNFNGLREKADKVEAKLGEVEARAKSNTHRIDKIESNQTWLWRTIAGAIIAAVVGAVFVFK